MGAPDDPQTTGQADRDALAALIHTHRHHSTWSSADIADRILVSDWLADLLAAERARTLTLREDR